MSLIPTSKISGTTLTLHELIPGGNNYKKFRPQLPENILWWGDKAIYIQNDTILQIPLSEKETETVLFTLDDLNKKFGKADQKAEKITDIYFPANGSNIISFKPIPTEGDENISRLYYDLEKDEFVSSYELFYLRDAANLDFSPWGDKLAYTIDNKLYISIAGNKETHNPVCIQSEEKGGISYGSGDVHRNEFGITKGTFWSPDGNSLAFYKMDESMVEDYPLVDISAREAKLKNIKYPMAGMASHKVWLGVRNVNEEEALTEILDTDAKGEKYLTNIAWSPDSKSIYIAELNRAQDTMFLNRYNAKTLKLETTICTETHPKFVEPENPVLFLKNNPNQFLWQSERDGYNHLYLYSVSGKLLKQLTKGNWEVTSVVGFDSKGDNVLIVSTEESPLERHIYKVNLKTGKRIKLTTEAGVHNPQMSASGRYIIDTFSSQYNPGKVAVIDTRNNSSYVFCETESPFKDYILPEITIGSIKADDAKTDLYYRLVKPVDFDASKKYPVIVYVYGGPHSQLVNNSWMAQVRGWDIYMAQLGYVVFTLDNRGTYHRGFDFKSIIHRQLGVVETQDQMKGVEFLKSLPYVDADRIGVHGWSYGGFMTLNLMLRHPETFKAGVAGGPVTDWKYYEVMYGERYMDTPDENPEGYKDSNMVDRAGDLQGRLLLIHGDEDPTVVMQNSMQFLKSSVKKGTHPDFFVYPGQGHNMTGLDRIHLYEHVTRYFEDFLK
ncbi:S9 family peptidase [Dysgonomonas sp. 520]|uniref:S9 family peptidase n=1 Tax=Dysgonomonas sp. 520 TaxID=2302931 RepID=UPI0021080E6C|nr:S9 family peptidase [Dysgonomonas sp. 520]